MVVLGGGVMVKLIKSIVGACFVVVCLGVLIGGLFAVVGVYLYA